MNDRRTWWGVLVVCALAAACGSSTTLTGDADDGGIDAPTDGPGDEASDADADADGDGDATDDGSETCLSLCGDGIIECGEECDDGNATSGDGCSPLCLIEAPPGCGDGTLDTATGEQCDDGNTTSGDGCSDRCLVETCGDGVLQTGLGETCDDGNTVPGDGCSDACAIESCGDGVLQTGLGEQCDDGNTTAGDGCDAACRLETVPVCGDGTVDAGAGEQCDDGNTTAGDGCDATCLVEFCGDGIVQAGLGEQCDDRNTIDGDGCSSGCSTERCGDGVLQTGLGEQCDDGNTTAGDGCDATCRREAAGFCGDGTLNAGEACDDGNIAPGDGCDGLCGVERCGDGIVQGGIGETCDDGNTTAGDGCDAACHAEPPATCGDGIVDYAAGEQCDDANTTAGDGCSAACRIEAPGSCGDGTLDLAAGEQCDDGNTASSDGCGPTCRFELVGGTCGDAILDPLEVCDDGNTTAGDGCNPTCNLAGTTSVFVGFPGAAGLIDGVGTGARLGGYGSLAADDRYLYYGDGANRVVRRIEIATAAVQTIAGDPLGGPGGYVDAPTGTTARFASVESLATDGTTLWVGDGGNRRIRAISLTPPFAVTTVAGSGRRAHTDGTGLAAEFDDLRGLTYYDHYVYLLDAVGATLRRFAPATNQVLTLAGMPYVTGTTDGLGSAGRFVSPRYMACDGSGMLYVADTNGSKIRAYNTVTTYLGTFAGTGTCGYVDGLGTAAAVHRPRGMTSDGTSIYWVEFNAHTIRQGVLASASVTTTLGSIAGSPCLINCSCGTSPTGGYAEGTGSAAVLRNPFSVVYHHPTSSLFLVDGGNFVIRRVR